MIRDRESNIWIAAGARGLIRVGQGTVQSADRTLVHVSTVFEDRDSNLWIGTDRGLERWRDPVFTTYASQQGLPSDAMGPIRRPPGGVVRPVFRWTLLDTRRRRHVNDRAARLADDVVYSIQAAVRTRSGSALNEAA